METKLQSKQQYPRFIQNKPCGIDKFDGGSQERLAKTIARHFCQNDSLDEECTLPRIIGIEGIWGSGKSNVVKMLERELSVSIRLRTTCIFDSKLEATCSSWPKLGQVDPSWSVLPTCLAGVHGELHGCSRSRVSGAGHPPSIHVD